MLAPTLCRSFMILELFSVPVLIFIMVAFASNRPCLSQEAHIENTWKSKASPIGELLIHSCANRIRNSSKGSFSKLFETEIKVDPRLGASIASTLEKIKKQQESEGFSSKADETLYSYDRLWNADFRSLSEDQIGTQFEKITSGWVSCGKSVKNIAGGARIIDIAGKFANALPGDIVLLRSPKRSRILVMVYAGEGSFQKGGTSKHSFFYFPFIPDKDEDLPRLRINTWPPRLTKSTVKALVDRGTFEKDMLQLPENAYKNQWLNPLGSDKNGKGVYGSYFIPVEPWKEQLNSFEVKVVRPKGHFLEFSVTRAEILREDIKRAVSFTIQAEKLLLSSTSDSDLDDVFAECFNTLPSDSAYPSRLRYVAHVLRSFREHLYKTIFQNDGAYLDLEDIDDSVLAYVTPAFRPMISIPERYFSDSNRDRSCTLVHEFCHSYGFAGHPGTGGYGGKYEGNDGKERRVVELVREFLISKNLTLPNNFSVRSEHPLVQVMADDNSRWLPLDKRKFLPPSLAIRNPYAYGYFILWLAQRKGW